MRCPPSYVVFDFETTGLSPQADRIIQVGLCEVVNRRVQRQAGWLVYTHREHAVCVAPQERFGAMDSSACDPSITRIVVP